MLITIEEGSSGGFGASVLTHLAKLGKLQSGARLFPMTLPDRFIAHGSPEQQYIDAGLMANNIAETALNLMPVGKKSLETKTQINLRKLYVAK